MGQEVWEQIIGFGVKKNCLRRKRRFVPALHPLSLFYSLLCLFCVYVVSAIRMGCRSPLSEQALQ